MYVCLGEPSKINIPGKKPRSPVEGRRGRIIQLALFKILKKPLWKAQVKSFQLKEYQQPDTP